MKNLPKSILITGASSGIGEALALEYAAPSVFLALCGRNSQRLEAVAQTCREKGAVVEAVVLDVTSQEEMNNWVVGIDQSRCLDLVIANAGVSGGSGGTVMAGEPMDQARMIFNVNLMGVLNTLAPVLPRMVERRAGQIAIISSMAGFRGFPSAPAYSASKGGVRFYGEALRGSLAPYNVKVNVVCPGFVRSRMTDANDFRMPFLMDTQEAAQIIAKGLARNKGRIAFPFPVHCFCWFLSILPDALAQRLLTKLPNKK